MATLFWLAVHAPAPSQEQISFNVSLKSEGRQVQLLFESAAASYITSFVSILYQTRFLNTKHYSQYKEDFSASEE